MHNVINKALPHLCFKPTFLKVNPISISKYISFTCKAIFASGLYRRLLLSCLALLYCALLSALPADFYATSSRLASGRWAKIEVKESGMQFISNATLRNLGFSNPEKVNVFGYGGRMLSEKLDPKMNDDLPLVRSLRTPSGIIFFGHSTVSWESTNSQPMAYNHTINPYSDKAYYFIGDVEVEQGEIPAAPAPEAVDADPIAAFKERIVHEQDLLGPSTTGRMLLGEDFRAQSTRTFPFSLPGNTGDANIRVRFGANVTNGSSSLMMSANGNQLDATTSDKISGVASSETFIAMTTSVKRIENPGERLSLAIQYSHSGALFTAALDYIEIEYPRQLKLYNGELYFYISPQKNSTVTIEGCGSSTVIWDVTDPLSPMLVDFTLSGTSASFNVAAGYQEFVAFNPTEIRRNVTPAGKVANQDIHAMEAPDMVIITPELFRNAAQRVADLHASTDGLKAIVLTPEQIYNEFSSGGADVTAFRKMLKMWHDRAGGAEGGYPRYCLLFSRPTYDNKMVTPTVKRAGYPRIPIWQSPTGLSVSTSYSTDDYIGMLADNNNTFDIASAQIHVAVGRMPVKSVTEANAAVSKLENYVKSPRLGAWRNNVMVIADDQDNGEHLDQAEKVITNLKKSGNGASFIYEKLYLDSYPLTMSSTGASYPLAKQRMLDKISEGVLFLDYIGHANPREWGHEKLLTWTDITSMSNRNLPFLYAATCEFLAWDDDEVSGGEEMWLHPEAGVIGMLCPSRKVYISLNGTLNVNTAPFVFRKTADGESARIGDFMLAGKNSLFQDSNKLRYALMGDPAMRLPSPSHNIVVESIGGTDIATADPLPILKARQKVKIAGYVADNGGNLIPDFNGKADILLYDAEKVIETYGNGKDGEVRNYNDRKTRLFIGKADVKEGRWETEIIIPAEIENNFSPAMLSAYAYDEQGREANGMTDRFYIYGYDENAGDDFEGPVITGFYLNSPSFTDGASVSPSSTLYATLSDTSGINVSEAGIGHDMILTIDGKQRFDDVALHYTPDTSIEKGSIAYPLDGLEPGDHELTLTVWDNANNSSSATLSFNIRADWKPSIAQLSTDVNPASSSVTFQLATDGVSGKTECRMDVFDLSGRCVWTDDSSTLSSQSNSTNIPWDLKDNAGRRVPRGIYLYRATVITPQGAEISKTGKLAVTAP